MSLGKLKHKLAPPSQPIVTPLMAPLIITAFLIYNYALIFSQRDNSLIYYERVYERVNEGVMKNNERVYYFKSMIRINIKIV